MREFAVTRGIKTIGLDQWGRTPFWQGRPPAPARRSIIDWTERRLMSAHNQPTDRGADAIWKAILRLTQKGDLFRLKDLMGEVGSSKNTLLDWLKRLQRRGYITCIGTLSDGSIVWRLPEGQPSGHTTLEARWDADQTALS